MLKLCSNILWLTIACSTLDATSLKVIFVNGSIYHIQKNSSQQKLKAGNIINQNGKIMVSVASSISFKKNNQYYTIEKPGIYTLSKLNINPVNTEHADELLINLQRPVNKSKNTSALKVNTRGFQDEGRYQVYLELLARKDYEMIIERLRRPVNSPEFFYKGRALLHLGQLSAAEKTLEQALIKKPKELALVKEIYSSLAFSYYKLKKYPKVEQCFQGMLSKGKNKNMIPPELWVMSTVSLEKSSKRAARSRAIQFRKTFPDHPLLSRLEPYIK